MQYFDGGQSPAVARTTSLPQVEFRPLMRLVYLWMGLGLLTTAVVSFFVASNTGLIEGIGGAWILIVFLQLGLVMGLSWGIRRMSPNLATILFFVYAAANGLTFGVMFWALMEAGQAMAIANAFFTTAGLFGVMTVIGFTTRVDLSRYSSYFMMALIGLVIAMVVNIFLGSSALDFIISVVGVLVFTALTAWDTQKLKEMAQDPELQEHSDSLVKLSILGALTLYLDFINLFLFLLRLFAGGRD